MVTLYNMITYLTIWPSQLVKTAKLQIDIGLTKSVPQKERTCIKYYRIKCKPEFLSGFIFFIGLYLA